MPDDPAGTGAGDPAEGRKASLRPTSGLALGADVASALVLRIPHAAFLAAPFGLAVILGLPLASMVTATTRCTCAGRVATDASAGCVAGILLLPSSTGA